MINQRKLLFYFAPSKSYRKKWKHTKDFESNRMKVQIKRNWLITGISGGLWGMIIINTN